MIPVVLIYTQMGSCACALDECGFCAGVLRKGRGGARRRSLDFDSVERGLLGLPVVGMKCSAVQKWIPSSRTTLSLPPPSTPMLQNHFGGIKGQSWRGWGEAPLGQLRGNTALKIGTLGIEGREETRSSRPGY